MVQTKHVVFVANEVTETENCFWSDVPNDVESFCLQQHDVANDVMESCF